MTSSCTIRSPHPLAILGRHALSYFLDYEGGWNTYFCLVPHSEWLVMRSGVRGERLDRRDIVAVGRPFMGSEERRLSVP